MEGAGVRFTVTQEVEPADNSPPALTSYSIPPPQQQQDSLPEEKALSSHLEEVPTGSLVRLEVSLCKEESINSLLEAPSALREEGLNILVPTSTLRMGQTNTLQRQEDSSSLQVE